MESKTLNLSSDQSCAFFNPEKTTKNRPAFFALAEILFSSSRTVWIFFDFVLTAFLFMVGQWASPFNQEIFWSWHKGFSALVFSLVFIFVGLGKGYYDRERRFQKANLLINSFFLVLIAASAVLGTQYLLFYDYVGRISLLLGASLCYLGILAFRWPLRWMLEFFPQRFTLVGKSDLIQLLEEKTKGNRSPHYQYVPWSTLYPDKSLDTINPLIQHRISDIVVSGKDLSQPAFIDFALHAIHSGCRIIDEISFYGQMFGQIPITYTTKTWLLTECLNQKGRTVNDLMKRTLDIFVSSFGILLLFPLMLVIILLIKLSSPGPAVFIQWRAGRFFKPFRMFKFRTMVSPENGVDHSENGFTRTRDPRITWLGKLLRPLHLDELPQLFNILKGDMSLVGPRPEALHFAERMKKQVPLYELRYLLRPGLTGQAQLLQGYALDTLEETQKKLCYDLYYLCRHTVTKDLYLMLQTGYLILKQFGKFFPFASSHQNSNQNNRDVVCAATEGSSSN
ncbi:MAG: sugar transferase [Pseudomonadota bacterium]